MIRMDGWMKWNPVQLGITPAELLDAIAWDDVSIRG